MIKDKIVNKSDFCAASTFPTKLLHNEVIKDKRIIPIHVQVYPTNRCNLSCSFCSVSDIDKKREIPIDQLKGLVDICTDRGTKAITISGGGEPLLHPHINEFIDYLEQKGIKVGLTTNGLLLPRLKYHNNLTWCRVSSGDDRTPGYSQIEKGITTNPETDWAFSHVIMRDPDYQKINGVIEFANRHGFTHVRLVNDLMDSEHTPSMDEVKRHIVADDKNVIYQGRKEWERGQEKCYMPLLKPVIAPEGIIVCCGSQYAIKGSEGHYDPKVILGGLEELATILDGKKPFDGRVCNRCYYGDYNQALSKLLSTPQHKEFV